MDFMRGCQYSIRGNQRVLVLLLQPERMGSDFRGGGQDFVELPAHHRAVLVRSLDETFLCGVPCLVVHRDKRGEEREDNLGEDLLLPCGGCRAVLPELVAAGTATAPYGGHGILHRHAVGWLYLPAHGGTWMSRLLKNDLMDDVFNTENESFMQETRLIEKRVFR